MKIEQLRVVWGKQQFKGLNFIFPVGLPFALEMEDVDMWKGQNQQPFFTASVIPCPVLKKKGEKEK